MNKRGIH